VGTDRALRRSNGLVRRASVAEALRAVIAKVSRLGTETVALDEARGRVLAADVVATRALPHFDNSAMDGYAARSSELPASLPLVGVVAAGAPHSRAVAARGVMRIYTGAPVPPELDTVVIQEDVTIDGDRIALPASPPGENIRRTGEDLALGDRVLSAGRRLSPWDLGVLAALGVAEVRVSRIPRVAVIATGDELVDVATPPGPGQLVASSSHALCALIAGAGGTAQPLGIVRDDVAALVSALDAAAQHDVVITTGGVSVGDRDHVREAFAAVGIGSRSQGRDETGQAVRVRQARRRLVWPAQPRSRRSPAELFVRPALLAMQCARRPLPTRARPVRPVTQAAGVHSLSARSPVAQGERLSRTARETGLGDVVAARV
jgi:molybdopterin molybdotransferase